ncbi:MAG TPA: shikimate dehydrogenase [Gemmatimonadaceae bacterium]|nr:shikimate dehydrogenase [Gemmatimonadaceae bacterium]
MRLPGRLVLLGHPVAHSLSPVMHNAALAAAGIPLRYELLDVPAAALDAVLASLAGERAAGNVTIPHKEAVVSLMNNVSPLAERIGAVNTFRTSDEGDLAGDNTDPVGFGAFVRAMLGQEPRNAHFAIVGAGGAAAAVLATIERWPGCSAGIYSRNQSRAGRLVARFPDVARIETLSEDQPVRGEIVINATPIGLESDDVPVSLAKLDRDAAVLDLAYRVGETAWVRLARAEGRIASDGLPMLLEQGAAAFEIWFGVQPDRDVMWTALKAATGRA